MISVLLVICLFCSKLELSLQNLFCTWNGYELISVSYDRSYLLEKYDNPVLARS